MSKLVVLFNCGNFFMNFLDKGTNTCLIANRAIIKSSVSGFSGFSGSTGYVFSQGVQYFWCFLMLFRDLVLITTFSSVVVSLLSWHVVYRVGGMMVNDKW